MLKMPPCRGQASDLCISHRWNSNFFGTRLAYLIKKNVQLLYNACSTLVLQSFPQAVLISKMGSHRVSDPP
jgi:hypothetical protein